jgi:predicted nucleotidyltransferase component of viral defense system
MEDNRKPQNCNRLLIPKAFITEWKNFAPWKSDYQVEQDLIIERALFEIFSNQDLNSQLAYRGGTALHKLYLPPAARYSEDIDLVQINKEPIGGLFALLRRQLSFLGIAKFKSAKHNNTLIYRIHSETVPIIKFRLKIEINTREHFSIFGFQKVEHSINSQWFSGKYDITTFTIEELLSTKLRALFQRRKGRDLFDLWYADQKHNLNIKNIIEGFHQYISLDGLSISSTDFIRNVEEKLKDSEFNGDITGLIRPDINYDENEAWLRLKSKLFEKL